MTYEALLLDVVDGVATVTLNRPDTLNSLNQTLRDETLAVCEELKNDDDVRAVVWTGAGRGFCSGADLSGGRRDRPEPSRMERLDEDHWVGRQARAVYGIDKPTIAAVNGPAAGAGMSLSLACDIRIGSENSRFKTVFIERALSPDSGMSYFLPRIVGSGNAMDLILTSRWVDADEALRMGLLQRKVPAEDLVAEAQKAAATIAGMPPLAAIMAKRTVQRSLDHTFDDQMRYEAASLLLAQKAVNDRKESGASFREGRKPTYTGT